LTKQMHENGQWLVYSLYVFKGIIKMVYCRSVHLFTKKKKKVLINFENIFTMIFFISVYFHDLSQLFRQKTKQNVFSCVSVD